MDSVNVERYSYLKHTPSSNPLHTRVDTLLAHLSQVMLHRRPDQDTNYSKGGTYRQVLWEWGSGILVVPMPGVVEGLAKVEASWDLSKPTISVKLVDRRAYCITRTLAGWQKKASFQFRTN